MVIIGLCICIKLGQLTYYRILDIDHTVYHPSPRALANAKLSVNETLSLRTMPPCPENGD